MLIFLIMQTFLDYLKFQKRYSQHTVISYRIDLCDFFDFMQVQYQEQHPEAIKPTFIRTWLASLKEKGQSSRSINRKISTLKSFFKFQMRQGKISISPMTTIVSPKQNKKLNGNLWIDFSLSLCLLYLIFDNKRNFRFFLKDFFLFSFCYLR